MKIERVMGFAEVSYCLDVVIIKAFLFFVPLRKILRGDEFTDAGKFLR